MFNLSEVHLSEVTSYKIHNLTSITDAGTETNNTSYESPNIQLFGAGWTRAWYYYGGVTPTCSKNNFLVNNNDTSKERPDAGKSEGVA